MVGSGKPPDMSAVSTARPPYSVMALLLDVVGEELTVGPLLAQSLKYNVNYCQVQLPQLPLMSVRWLVV